MSSSQSLDILLVEDNPADVRLTREGLDESAVDYELRHVDNVEDAWELLKADETEEGFDASLVLLDLNLPGAPGHELLRRVRKDLELGALPVVVVSTSTAPEDLETSYDLRANSYVIKPTDYELFLDRIRTLAEYWALVDRSTGASEGARRGFA